MMLVPRGARFHERTNPDSIGRENTLRRQRFGSRPRGPAPSESPRFDPHASPRWSQAHTMPGMRGTCASTEICIHPRAHDLGDSVLPQADYLLPSDLVTRTHPGEIDTVGHRAATAVTSIPGKGMLAPGHLMA
jgi:hypothetical protein